MDFIEMAAAIDVSAQHKQWGVLQTDSDATVRKISRPLVLRGFSRQGRYFQRNLGAYRKSKY